MSPFGYFMTLIAFVYAVALSHLLTGAARLLRHRRELRFSWPHALWMAAIFMVTVIDWISFWDANALKVIDLVSMTVWVATATVNYLAAALVAPEFERPEDYDLVRFQERQSSTYLTALLVLVVISMAFNAMSVRLGVDWARQNGLVAAALLPPLAALFVRNRSVQVAAPVAFMCLLVWAALAFYPRIA